MSYSKIDPKIGKRWVKELRSGEYEQRRGALGTQSQPYQLIPDKFCCLGILVDKCGIKGKTNTKWVNGALGVDTGNGNFMDAKLPLEVLDIVGMDGTTQEVLVQMNDGQACTFPQIADWIEENLL